MSPPLAQRAEARPASLPKPRKEVEIDLVKDWKELDKALEGVEREERVRRELRIEGGTSFGESDAAVRKGLAMPPGEPAPDFSTSH